MKNNISEIEKNFIDSVLIFSLVIILLVVKRTNSHILLYETFIFVLIAFVLMMYLMITAFKVKMNTTGTSIWSKINIVIAISVFVIHLKGYLLLRGFPSYWVTPILSFVVSVTVILGAYDIAVRNVMGISWKLMTITYCITLIVGAFQSGWWAIIPLAMAILYIFESKDYLQHICWNGYDEKSIPTERIPRIDDTEISYVIKKRWLRNKIVLPIGTFCGALSIYITGTYNREILSIIDSIISLIRSNTKIVIILNYENTLTMLYMTAAIRVIIFLVLVGLITYGVPHLKYVKLINEKYLSEIDRIMKERNAKESSVNIEEKLTDLYKEKRDALCEKLQSKIVNMTPDFFGKFVVELLLKMGYGESGDKIKNAMKKMNNFGIEWTIKEDKLGFDSIYIQTISSKKDGEVGKKEIREFVKLLAVRGAKKGIFITTSEIPFDARNCISQNDTKVALIDRKDLANLMIDYNLGCATEQTYEIKEIDNDYFDEG